VTHWLATCHWLKVNFTYENKGPRFLQVDTMKQKYHNSTQNFHRNKINWKLSPKKPHKGERNGEEKEKEKPGLLTNHVLE
jgi:hypothetical protein